MTRSRHSDDGHPASTVIGTIMTAIGWCICGMLILTQPASAGAIEAEDLRMRTHRSVLTDAGGKPTYNVTVSLAPLASKYVVHYTVILCPIEEPACPLGANVPGKIVGSRSKPGDKWRVDVYPARQLTAQERLQKSQLLDQGLDAAPTEP